MVSKTQRPVGAPEELEDKKWINGGWGLGS